MTAQFSAQEPIRTAANEGKRGRIGLALPGINGLEHIVRDEAIATGAPKRDGKLLDLITIWDGRSRPSDCCMSIDTTKAVPLTMAIRLILSNRIGIGCIHLIGRSL